MIRSIFVLTFWGLWTLFNAPWGIPYMMITKRAGLLYKAALWGAYKGAQMGGAKVEIRGRENLQPGQNYIFMSNHVSNLDPPILIPLIPGQTSVLVKKELFKIPLLGRAMKLASLVPVDRTNRDAAIASIREATEVLRKGLHMTVFPEGTRSADGKMRPMKKGPFYLAEESGVPVVPVTLRGTYEMWPKTRFAMKPGPVVLTYHSPITFAQAGSREALMAAVKTAIESGLPEDQRSSGPDEDEI